ncbi:unnamed protein product [Blepharisma stoltei]|uniref:RCC1-like domain-containing protein n=1 Tax=Blepharisma stoltei TaxID=1481888 RepID=A0AAU9KII1_9CILI|nr:unnamed protein product [Blepharisma stoltei]
MITGNVYTFGIGKSGELGSRSNKEIVPFRIRELSSIVQVGNGGSYALCLQSNGNLYFFGKGKNARGGSNVDSPVPRHLSYLPKIMMIACGYWHSLVLTESGFIMASGYNSHGQLGLGSTQEESKFTSTNTEAKIIKAGGHASFAITQDNTLVSCGIRELNAHNQDRLVFTPVMENVEYIDIGMVHAGCISQGQLYMWGNNAWGQLGIGNTAPSSRPIAVASLAGIQIKQVSCSKGEKYGHTGCIDNDRNVYMWGSGYKGKLGLDAHWSHEDPADRYIPEVIQNFKADYVECGGIHSLAISDARLFTWGCGSDGRLGHPEVQGHRYLYKEPLPRAIGNLNGVVQVSSSYYSNIILTN